MVAALAAATLLAGCSVWPVNQDPDGIALRQDANHIIWALQDYRRDHRSFPVRLNMLTPRYIRELPDIPGLHYHSADGSLSYSYIPTWPQLRWTSCNSIGNSTVWRCRERMT